MICYIGYPTRHTALDEVKYIRMAISESVICSSLISVVFSKESHENLVPIK